MYLRSIDVLAIYNNLLNILKDLIVPKELEAYWDPEKARNLALRHIVQLNSSNMEREERLRSADLHEKLKTSF